LKLFDPLQEKSSRRERREKRERREEGERKWLVDIKEYKIKNKIYNKN
jgi:hypothetical protein